MVPIFIEEDTSAPMWVKVIAVSLFIALVVYIVIDSRQ
jgi:hypothetical protein